MSSPSSYDYVSARTFNGAETQLVIDRDPDECPECHRRITPHSLAYYLDWNTDESERLQAVYRCPDLSCRTVFLALYVLDGTYDLTAGTGFNSHIVPSYRLDKCEPQRPSAPEVSDRVAAVSATFAEIYAQAAAAEALSLLHVAGPGYRKALEFLVKDYLSAGRSESGLTEERIRETSLGACIEKHFVDQAMKKAAKRAAWLGNDQTHYYRTWHDHDLEDLKSLLRITINAIDNELLLRQYEESLPEADAGR